MGIGSYWHWLIVLLVVLLLFGGRKIPELMKGLGAGIKNFKKELKDDESDEQNPTLKTSALDSSPQIIESINNSPLDSSPIKPAKRDKEKKI